MHPLRCTTLLTLAGLSSVSAYAAEPVSRPPVAWVVDSADVTVHVPSGPTAVNPTGEPTIDLVYTFRRVGEIWTTLRLADGVLPRDVTSPASAEATDGALVVHLDALSLVHLDPRLDRTTARLSGYLAVDGPDHAFVQLPAAPRALLHVDAPGLDVDAAGSLPAGAARVLPPDGRLDLSWRPHQPERVQEQGALVRAEASTAAWSRDGALNVRSRIRFIATRGAASELAVDVSGLEEIEVEGPVAHTLSGSTLTLTPSAPLEGMLTVEITGRRAAVSGKFPSPTPLGVTRTETWYTLGKPDEGDVVPSGGAAVSARQLPTWARGLSDAAPLAYWSSPPTLASGQFETLLGPDTIVQSAEYVVSQSEDGHVLARATWLVRNERSQYLEVVPPEGFVPLTARVSGRPALLLHEGGAYFVPLEKSIETVQGLLAFPVEVAWIGEDAPWSGRRHAERSLKLPAVNAPIQSASWEVHLPRGWRVDGKQPAHHAAEPPPPPLDPAKEQAREAWTNAIESYKKNDFKDAQRWLDASRSYADKAVVEDAATMDNVGRLQSNLDVLLPAEAKAAESTADDLLARRVRDLANAKTTDAQLQQSKYEEQARKALLAGDDQKAVEALEEVTKLAKDIRLTEQKESNEQADKLSAYSQELEEANDRVAKKSKGSGSSGFVPAIRGGVSSSLHGASAGEAMAEAPAAKGEGYRYDDRDEDESVAVGGKVATTGSTRTAPAAPPPPPPPPEPSPVVAPYPASDEPMTLEEAEAELADDYAYDDAGVEVDVVGERSVVDTEQAALSTAMTSEYLQRIPTGRSYQDAVAQAAGVVSETPDYTQGVARPAPKTAAPPAQKPASVSSQQGRPVVAANASPAPEVVQSEDGELGYLQESGPSWSATREAPKKRAEKADDRSDQDQRAANENTLIVDGFNVTDPGVASERERAAARAREKAELKLALERERVAAAQVKSRAKANRNVAPDTRERRNPLAVEASPLTPALPLDGARVDHSAALIDAGEFPTFVYTASPDPTSDTFKE